MILFYIITVLALILRLLNLENLALGDECYSLFIAQSPHFSDIFQDMGNPPFYFLILKLLNFLKFNVLSFKLTSVLFNTLSIIAIWFILKKKFNLKCANIGAFLASINLVMIYFSLEIRCYSLLTFLTPIIVYFFFEAIQKRKNIYFILYGFLGIIAINTHYYMTFFLLSNFIFGLIYLHKRKSSLLKFVLANLIIFLSFLPFFILITKNAILNNYNESFENISYSLIKRQVLFIFGGMVSFLLSILFFIKTIFHKKRIFKTKLYIFYIFYTIFAVLFLSIITSLLIRPIIIERYFCFLIPLFIIFLSVIFDFYKKKLYLVIFLIWIISFQYSSKINDMRPLYKFEQKIFEIAPNTKNTYVIIRPITKYYVLINKTFENINIVEMPVFNKKELQGNIENKINEILKENKHAIIYTVLLEPNKNNARKYKCFYDKNLDLCLWEIKN